MKEMAADCIAGAALITLIAWLFYHSFLAIPFLLPAYVMFLLWRKKKREQKKTIQMRREFKDFLTSLSAAVTAGKSVENSLREIHQEFVDLYGEKAWITGQMASMNTKLKYNQSVEDVFVQWGEETGLKEIILFSEVFQTAKTSGGNMTRIIRITADSIRDMLELREETQAYIHGKKTEQSIMNVMPMALLLYLNVCSPGFFQGVYGNLFGIGFMTVCLVIYAGAVVLSDYMITQALDRK